MSQFVLDTNADTALLEANNKVTKKNKFSTTNVLTQQIDKELDLLTPNVQTKRNEFDLSLKEWIAENKKSKAPEKPTSIDQFCASMGWGETFQNALMKQPNKEATRGISIDLSVEEYGIPKVKEVMKDAITNGIEKRENLEVFVMSKNKLKRIGRKERDLTKGKNWFDMPATEVTEEIKNDLEILQMRSVLDPKHFYKKNDLKVLPKYFQIGKVLPSPLEYYNDRGTKKSKKRSIAEELLNDSSFQDYNKRKYEEVSETLRNPGYYKTLKKMKKDRKKR